MKKAIIFFLGVITGRYLITLVDKGFSVLLHGYHIAYYIPYTKSYRPAYINYHSYSAYGTNSINNELKDITFKSRKDAQDVLDKCIEDIDKYGKCSVATFKEYTDEIRRDIKSTRRYLDYKYGWKSLRGARINPYHVFGYWHLNYKIDLPNVELLEAKEDKE